MTECIHITSDQLDEVLDNLLVLRPPIDRVRFCAEFTTADVICIYDRPDADPRLVLSNPGQSCWLARGVTRAVRRASCHEVTTTVRPGRGSRAVGESVGRCWP
jgi:hypothetical protein